MKVVIFAGGLGTRLMEETEARPKPMVEIGGKPILWHIMKIYEAQGFNDFIICLGYKQSMIKEYFMNYFFTNSDITIDLATNETVVHQPTTDNFKVTLVDTGLETNTAGRLKRIERYINNETFMLTYGDGVSDINLNNLLEFHKEKGKLATLTSIQLPGKFGNLDISDNGQVLRFVEKPIDDGVWINGGFMVLEPDVFKYLLGDADSIQFEKGPLIELTKSNQLVTYKHTGFWKCMDALRDKIELEQLWANGIAPWKNWKN
jgi:glucose-1-phosphate cytidylyltransferase